MNIRIRQGVSRHALRAVVISATFAAAGCAYFARTATQVYMQVDTALSGKYIGIEIKKSFIEKYQDRVSIDADFTVDKSMQNPVAKAFDGDLHMAGRAPQIGLPTVAEIANGASEKEAVALVHRADSTKKPLRLSGVWRVWPEHAGGDTERQGKPLEPLDSYAPDHVFEIHPITRVSDVDVRRSFRPVDGFLPGDAKSTLTIYERTECTIKIKPKSITIVTEKGVYNDVEFIMEIIDGHQQKVPGGRIVLASARDLQGKMLVDSLRMIFAEGTPPEIAVRNLARGARLHVFGMPRVNFHEISRRVEESEHDPSLLKKTLPYEIIVIGVYTK